MSRLSKLIILLIFICLLILLIFYIYDATVGSIDGERVKKSELIIWKGVFFETINKQIYKEIDDGLSESIISGKIDSLIWNNESIIGFAEHRYFIITRDRETYKVLYFENKSWHFDSLLHLNKVYFRMYQVPPLSNFTVGDGLN